MLAAVLLLILVGKSLIALAVVLLLGYPLSTALMVWSLAIGAGFVHPRRPRHRLRPPAAGRA
ncbi:MAG: hypothetical protein IPN24_20660 [Betaproteobacteria bacterium]|nr:hypothetical protein [Betaproteobacteria bacterium]